MVFSQACTRAPSLQVVIKRICPQYLAGSCGSGVCGGICLACKSCSGSPYLLPIPMARAMRHQRPLQSWKELFLLTGCLQGLALRTVHMDVSARMRRVGNRIGRALPFSGQHRVPLS